MTNLSGFTHDQYEEGLSKFEAAQSLVLSREDLPEAARMAGSFALIASEVGNTSLAESAHRTAIHAYALDHDATVFEQEDELAACVAPVVLNEYARLAETLAASSRTFASHRRLSRLRREVLSLGPVDAQSAVTGMFAAQAVERGLATHSYINARRHIAKADRLNYLCQAATTQNGLGLLAITGGNVRSRTIAKWIKDTHTSALLP
ncbi:MAG: hypothetical protein JWO35_858 [Candidatus Saccharibacteria bacterium]|nr:hypothetical protein [Candidatus Saccharibacteria bacterium]